MGLEVVHVQGQGVEGGGVDRALESVPLDEVVFSPDHFLEGEREDAEKVVLADVFFNDLFSVRHRVS